MVRSLALAVAYTVAAAVVACSGSPSAPSDPGGTATANGIQGQAVDALAGSGEAGLSVYVGDTPRVTTDRSGNFNANVAAPGTYSTTIAGGGVVERHTTLSAPTSGRARLSLIPATFDLDAFNQMFRGTSARLERWTSRPSLVIIASILTFVDGAESFAATNEQMTDDEVSLLNAQLVEGLSLLTGSTYGAFADVQVERPAAGQQVLAARLGKIVVGRFVGINSSDGTIGLGRWAEESDGTVDAGMICLSRDFDKVDSRRRLLRIHELGHALGYLHVTTRTSIMNPVIGPDPTDFDRAGAIIAFQRMPGNQTPDIDPAATTVRSSSSGRPRWSKPLS
jgi:hypothetical protein